MSEIAWWRLTESIIFPAWWGGRWGCLFIVESCSVKLIAKISGRSFEFQLEFRESLGQKPLFVSERQRKRHRYLPLWISGVESKTPSSSQHRCPCSLNSHWRAIVHLFCLLSVENFHQTWAENFSPCQGSWGPLEHIPPTSHSGERGPLCWACYVALHSEKVTVSESHAASGFQRKSTAGNQLYGTAYSHMPGVKGSGDPSPGIWVSGDGHHFSG